MAYNVRSHIEKLLLIQEEIGKLFRSIFEVDQKALTAAEGTIDPSVDIYETHDKLFIEIEIPGCIQKDIEVYVSRNLLVVEGIKRDRIENQSTKRVNYLCMERDFGRFRKTISIPIASDTRSIHAKLHKGILCVSIPKLSDRRGERKRIEIEEMECEEE